MKPLSRATSCLLALVIVAGCASTEIAERQRYEGEELAWPDRIIAYDFTANSADVPPESAFAAELAGAPAPTAEQLEVGRKLGAQVAKELVAELQDMGLPAVPAAGQPPPRPDDIVLRGYFVSVDEGSAGQRVLVGFGSGAAELRTAVEAYQMTPEGLRPLGRGEIRSEGGELPGMVVPLAVVAATANPIGLIVGGTAKRPGRRPGRRPSKAPPSGRLKRSPCSSRRPPRSRAGSSRVKRERHACNGAGHACHRVGEAPWSRCSVSRFVRMTWRATRSQTERQTMTSWLGSAGRTRRMLLMGLAVLVSVAPLAACDQAVEAPAAAVSAPPSAVTVVSVQPTEVTPSIAFNGRVEAVDLVQLRARVTGFLEQRRFEEGADVAAGDLLFVIEKAPYEAVVAQRQAELASAQANKANTAAQLQRGEELVKNDNIPKSEVDIRRANDEMAAAAIQEAQAALERAQINLSYTDIHAPIDGRISRAAASVGNLVGPESDVLATIVSQDPIYVTFPVSQRQLMEYRREQGGEGGAPVVRVTQPDGTLYEHPGEVNFLDVQVDQSTDTVTVRAELPNPDRTLVHGQFVSVRVERGEPEQVLVVPQAALQVNQAGPYVLVVGGDDKVEARRVTLGAAEGDRAVVRDGLKEGERVIVEGVQKVRPGMTVAASEAPPPGAPQGQSQSQQSEG